MQSVADLYDLDWERVEKLERMGRAVDVQPARLDRRVHGPGRGAAARRPQHPHLGPAGAEALVAAFGDLDRIMGASVEELAAAEGVGQVIAESVRSGSPTAPTAS